MSSKQKYIVWSLLSLLAIFILARIYYTLTDDFRIGNIIYQETYEEILAIPQLSQEEEERVQGLLDQTYTYLGKGAQSYAFASADGNYVLKFFKFKHLRPSSFWEYIPSIGPIGTYKKKLAARKRRKLIGVFRAYKLAYDRDREESRMIYVQLNTLGNHRHFVTVLDKIGFVQTINLEHIPFVIQEKGETLRSVLGNLLSMGDIINAKERINQVFDMYMREYQKGIFDHDHGVMRNIGFIKDKVFHLDVGKLVKKKAMQEKAVAKQDALLVADKIKKWIKHNYPEYEQELADFIDQKLNQSFD